MLLKVEVIMNNICNINYNHLIATEVKSLPF